MVFLGRPKALIVSALVAFTVILGPNVAPAGAFVLPAYAHAQVQYGTCHVDVTWGQYGSAGYAVMSELAGSACQYNTSVVVAVTGGLSQWCSNYMRLSNPYPNNCSFNGLSTMSYGTGTAYGGMVYLCTEQAVGGPLCSQVGFGPWG